METHVEHETSKGHDKKLVTIEVNAKVVRVLAGHNTVAQIKEAAGCPLAFELEQIEHGKLIALADDAIVEIKGGERFLCHPRDGASS